MRSAIPIVLASVLVTAVASPGALATQSIGVAGVAPAAHPLSHVGAPGQDSKEVRRLLSPHGRGKFSVHFRIALDTFQKAEELYFQAKYKKCKRELDDLWDRFPPGTPEWAGLRSPTPDVFVGNPACYASLLMLTDAVDWRLRSEKDAVRPDTLTLTVVLVGRSRGREPLSMSDLERGSGREVDHSLEALLLEKDHRVIRESLRLFGEYVLAITEGRLEMQVEVLHLEDLVVPVHAEAQPLRRAGLQPGAEWAVWDAVPREVRERTDWWWLLYPSHVPEQYPDFVETEFITGGMGIGPDGQSPCFIIDDRWLVRKPPHLGRGPYSDFERRAYLPKWFQHEFFHHLYRTYPELELEKEGHQWFDRTTWPADFEGLTEQDYYRESLHKRLKSVDPPLHASLRYRGPDPEILLRLDSEALLGSYERRPVENEWHVGRIEATSKTERGVRGLRWVNEAGRRWNLEPDLENGRLLTGPDCDYYEVGGRSFQVVLRRGADGRHLPEVVGFRFRGELYALQGP